MQVNYAPRPLYTHEGGVASHIKPIDELRRTALACLLWEDSAYESGESIVERIKRLVAQCDPQAVADLAVEARERQHLRHLPLLLVRELARHPSKFPVAETLARVIQRADEIPEFIALYWKDKRQPLSKQVKRGLAKAFQKFGEYALAKYNRDRAVKLRDALFLVHAKPKDDEQAALWKRLVDGTLATPDTWETALSSGQDKRATFERLIAEKNLGYLALLRNLRTMQEVGVDRALVERALLDGAAKSRALPFRFITAARAVPSWEPMIEAAMRLALAEQPKLPGKTVLLVDVSGSMDYPLSSKSDLKRIDAACALAILLRGICEEVRVFTFSDLLVEVPPREGMALADAVVKSQQHSGTLLGDAVRRLGVANLGADRLIVITDEQTADVVPAPLAKRGYMLNVANNQNGVGYGQWLHVNGFSESVVRYIAAYETVAKA